MDSVPLCSYCVPVSRKRHVYGSFHLDTHSVIRDLLHGIPAHLLFPFFMVPLFQSKRKILKDDLSLQSTKPTAYKKELLRQRCDNNNLFPEYLLIRSVWLGCDGVLSNLNPVENLLILFGSLIIIHSCSAVNMCEYLK